MKSASDVLAQEWEYVVALLPADLERSAVKHGAIVRRRRVTSASALLRLALGYAVCDWPLRTAAALSESIGLGPMSDVAVLKRLRRCGPWLGWLTGQWFVGHGLTTALPPRRLRLVDASTVSRPGSTGADWRLHASYDVVGGRFDEWELTTGTGGESLARFHGRPGDVLVADRGYAHPRVLGDVAAHGIDFVVRFPWSNLHLLSSDGQPLDLLAFLHGLPEATAVAQPVYLDLEDRAVRTRLVAVRKSVAATESAHRRILHEARRKGKEPDPRTLQAAAYVFVLTTLPPTASASQVLEIYRARWQIEIAFKRLKSVLQFDALRARDPALAQTYLYGKLLGCLLVDDLTRRAKAFSPWGYPLPSEQSLQYLASQRDLAAEP